MPNIQNFEKILLEIRKFIFDTFVETSNAPVVEHLIKKFNLPRADIEEILHTLEKRQMLVVQPSSNKILMLHPFSNIPTTWVVKPNNGKVYYANCAWDSIAMHFSLHEDIDIDSFCLYCNVDIHLRLENKKIVEKTPEKTLIAISKPASKWWDNIVDTCGNNMNFFCSEEHLKAWEKERNIKTDQIGIFSDTAVLELSKLLYSTKDLLDYTRPTDEEEIQMFKKLDLVGDFWEGFRTE